MKSFPKGAHDDMVDETTQAINYININYNAISYSEFNQGMQEIGSMRF
jgi:hypothetical protein